MAQEINHPRTTRMWILLAPGAAYLVWVLLFPAFTVGLLFDGSVGVLLGLYICSQPAANGIDLMFMQRGAFRRAVKQSVRGRVADAERPGHDRRLVRDGNRRGPIHDAGLPALKPASREGRSNHRGQRADKVVLLGDLGG